MKLSSLFVANFKGIGELELKPKSLTVLKGENGCGKTSVLDAIQEIFEGGHHPEHIRIGQKKAEIAMTFMDDAGASYTAKKTITAKGYTLIVSGPDGEPVPAPQTWLNQLADGIAYDPIRFIEDKKERGKFLQAVLAQSFSRDEILDAMPAQLQKEAEALVRGSMDLAGLDALRKRFYDTRRDQNTIATRARNTVITLKNALPEEGISGDPAAALKDANLTLARVSDEKGRKVDAARRNMDADIEKIRQAFGIECKAIDNEYEPKILDAKVAIDKASDQVRQRGRLEEVQRQITTAEQEATSAHTTADRLSRALDGIDALKERKLSQSPIPDAEIRDGELFIDGIPFDQVNTQRQYELAFAFGSLRPGGLGLMICDRAEAFSPDNWTAFKETCAGSGFQVILARVEPEPELQVEYA